MNFSNMHIAQLNIGRLLGDVRVAGFVDPYLNTKTFVRFKTAVLMFHSFEEVRA